MGARIFGEFELRAAREFAECWWASPPGMGAHVRRGRFVESVVLEPMSVGLEQFESCETFRKRLAMIGRSVLYVRLIPPIRVPEKMWSILVA
jgi:hypothetical protein